MFRVKFHLAELWPNRMSVHNTSFETFSIVHIYYRHATQIWPASFTQISLFLDIIGLSLFENY